MIETASITPETTTSLLDDDLVFSMGPGVEILDAKSDQNDDNDYIEIFGNADFRHYPYGQVIILLKSQAGIGEYSNNPDFTQIISLKE